MITDQNLRVDYQEGNINILIALIKTAATAKAFKRRAVRPTDTLT